MHHSDDPDRRCFAVACYVDESGTHQDGVLAVVGGPIIPRQLFTSFQLGWDTVLARHNITGPIHMREFNRPHKRLAHLSDDKRRALFQDLVQVITDNKLYSVSASVLEKDFRDFFPLDRFKGLFEPAPLAFIWCVILNLIVADNAEKIGPTAYLVATSDERTQMLECHAFLENFANNSGDERVGSITFDSPKRAYALQAADMIAWSNRKHKLGEMFGEGFQPLERLTRHVKGSERNYPHFHFDVPRESTKKLAEIVNAQFPILPKLGTIKLLLSAKDRKMIEGLTKTP